MKNNLLVIFALLSVGLWACGGNEKKAETTIKTPQKTVAKVNPGKSVYRKAACGSCHGTDGKKGMYQASDLSTTTMTMEERTEIIANGKGNMNAFKDVLSPKEISQVAQYIDQLKEK
ncbi:cytochrome c [Persicobacter psychrovividus]|uniref:Cytochrome c domain-containing protein n=1 Tax=Persicobacter psychrovividus TaxID=387638 RepID=A0ABN6L533_9BACT|nr:hypothetical protein PEPS_04690 [Persicobacter psychrovividus]